MVKKKFTLPKLDIFQIQFLVWLVLFTSQRRFEWCIELIVSFNEAEVFRIFHDEMKNQKVVRLTTRVMKWNYFLHFHRIWLKRSGRKKIQVD